MDGSLFLGWKALSVPLDLSVLGGHILCQPNMFGGTPRPIVFLSVKCQPSFSDRDYFEVKQV